MTDHAISITVGIYLDAIFIGNAELQHLDQGMGVAHGYFHPAGSYSQFRERVTREAESRHLRKDYEPLIFEVRSLDGHSIVVGFVQLDDFADVHVEPEVSIQFLSPQDLVGLSAGAV